MNKRFIPLMVLASAMLLVGCGNKNNNNSQQGGSGDNPGTSTVTPTGPVTFDFMTLTPTSSSSTQQVFEQGGVNFTNNKASSATDVSVKNPIRCYKNSEIVITASANIAKLEFLTQNFTESSGTWAYSFKGTETVTAGTWNAPAAVSGQDTNSSLDNINAATVTITLTACQVRIKTMTVTFA